MANLEVAGTDITAAGQFIEAVGGTNSSSLSISTDEIGIGSDSPEAKLDVRGNVDIGDGFVPVAASSENILNLAVGQEPQGNLNGISFVESTTGFGMKLGYDGTGVGPANAIRIYDNTDTSIFTVQNGGNVGIGTDNPDSELHVDKGNIKVEGDQHDVMLHLKTGVNDDPPTDYSLKCTTSSAGGIGITANGTEQSDFKFFIKRVDGNIGIGTKSPEAKLDVRGNVDIGDALTTNPATSLNILNLQVGIDSGGDKNGIGFYLNSDGDGMHLGYDATGGVTDEFA